MRRPPRRPSGAREHDAQHVCVLVVGGERAEAQEISAGLRCEPLADVRGGCTGLALPRLEPRQRITQLTLEHERVVRRRLDAHQQAVERRDVDTSRVEPTLERLHERRPRARERIEHAAPLRHVAPEELLDELRDVLAEIGMEAVDVLGAHALRQLLLGPGEVEVEPRIDLLLRDRHGASFHGEARASCTCPL